MKGIFISVGANIPSYLLHNNATMIVAVESNLFGAGCTILLFGSSALPNAIFAFANVYILITKGMRVV